MIKKVISFLYIHPFLHRIFQLLFNSINMRHYQLIQGLTSIAALICLLVGWLNLFSPEINDLLYQRVFYFLIGTSFVFQSQVLANPKFMYPMLVAAALCIVGAFLPLDSRFSVIKTIGLFAGVIIALFNRQRVPRN